MIKANLKTKKEVQFEKELLNDLQSDRKQIEEKFKSLNLQIQELKENVKLLRLELYNGFINLDNKWV